jgi:hypothetical protein
MRHPILALLVGLALLLTACTIADTSDDVDVPVETPTPTVQPTPTSEPTPAPEPTVTPEPDDDVVTDDDVDADPAPSSLREQIDQILQNTIELRGLEMLDELNFEMMTRAELRAYLEQEVEIEQDEIDIDWILRLLDDRYIDLEQILIDLQTEQALGFYDVEAKTTYVVSDRDDEMLSPVEEVTMAHEIVHALQDQHFGLDIIYDEEQFERAMAFRSVIEGDAVLTQELYAQTYFSEERRREYLLEAFAMMQDETYNETMERIPEYILDTFFFPYSAGPEFILRLYDGTFDQIDEHLADPPVSTRQILNPQQYLAGDIPDPVDVPLLDLTGTLGGDWESTMWFTTGEFMLILILEENGISPVGAETDGLAGAEIEVYRSGDEILAVLGTVWETAEDADMFLEALMASMDGYEEHGGHWSENSRYHTIIADGEDVTLISSSDESAIQRVVEANG